MIYRFSPEIRFFCPATIEFLFAASDWTSDANSNLLLASEA